MKLYRREHYNANKDAYKLRAKNTKQTLQQYVLDIKNSTPCTDCGVIYQDEPWLTEFDHVSDNKSYEISTLLTMGSLKNLQQEIAKCELLCLICHRRRTAKRGNWGSYMGAAGQ